MAAVIGLNNLVHTHALALTRSTRSAGSTGGFPAAKSADFAHPAGSPTACAGRQRDAAKNGGLTDDQIANAYGAFGLYGAGDLGAGQHIAIYENEPFLRFGHRDVRHLLLRRRAGREHDQAAARDRRSTAASRRDPAAARRVSTSRTSPRSLRTRHRRLRRPVRRRRRRRLRPGRQLRGDHRCRPRPGSISTSWGLCEQASPAGPAGPAAGGEPPVRAGRRAGTECVRLVGGQRLGRLQHVRDADAGLGTEPGLGR